MALCIDAIESEVQGDEVTLRPARLDDARAVFGWAVDPAVAPWWGGRGFYRDYASFLEDWGPYYFDGTQPQQGRCLIIEITNDDGALPIGAIAVNHIDTHNLSTEFDILIGDSEQRRKGYGTDALRALARLLFTRVGLHRVWAGTYEDNTAARRAFEKAGFVREGLLRESDRVEGRWVNVVIYGMLSRELT